MHVHHLEISTPEWKWKQLSAIIERIYNSKAKSGSGGSQIKWKLLLFDESDFFSFEASLFFIFF